MKNVKYNSCKIAKDLPHFTHFDSNFKFLLVSQVLSYSGIYVNVAKS